MHHGCGDCSHEVSALHFFDIMPFTTCRENCSMSNNTSTQRGMTKSFVIYLFFSHLFLSVSSLLTLFQSSERCFFKSSSTSHSLDTPVDKLASSVHHTSNIIRDISPNLCHCCKAAILLPWRNFAPLGAGSRVASPVDLVKAQTLHRPESSPSFVPNHSHHVSHAQLNQSQGHPTNFRREPITLGADINGNAMIIEQAREDAQDMYREHKGSRMGTMRGHARNLSAKLGGPKRTFGRDLH